jgi:hypothetical protein
MDVSLGFRTADGAPEGWWRTTAATVGGRIVCLAHRNLCQRQYDDGMHPYTRSLSAAIHGSGEALKLAHIVLRAVRR